MVNKVQYRTTLLRDLESEAWCARSVRLRLTQSLTMARNTIPDRMLAYALLHVGQFSMQAHRFAWWENSVALAKRHGQTKDDDVFGAAFDAAIVPQGEQGCV